MTGRAGSHWWIENLLRPVLIAAMLTCLATPLVLGMQWLSPDWNGAYLMVFMFFAGLEGILSERMLRQRAITGQAYLLSRGAEVVILLILLKLVNYIPLGLDQLWFDVLSLPYDPGRFFTNTDLFTSVIFLLLWDGAIYTARRARELDADGGKIPPPPDKTSIEYYLWLTQPPPLRDRQEALDTLAEWFVWGGVAMLLASAAMHVLLSAAEALALPVLLYFALGVALLSQARFSVAHAGWQSQGIPVQPGIARRWLVWVAIFLVGVALLALLLPTRYAMGPILAVYNLVLIIAQAIMSVVMFLFYLAALLLSFLLPSVEPPEQPPPQAVPIPPIESAPAAGSLPWLQVLVSAFFWTVILVIAGYALIRFLRDRFDLLAREEEVEETWWGHFLAWLRALWRRWRGWQQAAQARLARRRARPVEASLAARIARFFSPRRLSPRERVRFFYLSAVKRAAQAGQPRGPGQTPGEYRATLDARFSDLEPDLTDLTDAFVEARYSQRPIEPEDARAVEPFWRRVMAALRRRRSGSQGDPEP